MKVARPFFASLSLAAIMAAVSAWALARLPGASVPVHWALDGRPDRFGRPTSVLFLLPGIAVALSLMFAAMPMIMPPRGDLSRSRRPYEVDWIGAVLLLLVVHLGIVAKVMGAAVDIPRLSVIGVSALLLVMGNYLPKVRYNFVMGIRTPWTLADERVWDRTHRFAGVCMVLAGLVALAGGLLFADPVLLLGILLVPTVGAVLASVVYSAVISPRVG